MQTLFYFMMLMLSPAVYGTVDMFEEPQAEETTAVQETVLLESYDLYNQLGLEEMVPYEAFQQAYTGFTKIEDKEKNILTLIDFSKPSNEERLFVLDLDKKQVLHKSLVSHGKNSGLTYALSFSNTVGSFQSSLGFFLTESTYNGKNGYSLILNGLEEGINGKARERAIVMHGSRYVTPAAPRRNGAVGRSLGCPALPYAVTKPIINTIKGKSVVFIYADHPDYLAESAILSQPLTASR